MKTPAKAGSPLVKRPLGKGMKKGPGPKEGPGLNTIRAGLKRQSGAPTSDGGEGEPQWLRVQKAIYGRFVEQRLLHGGIKGVKIDNVLKDLSDGKLLVRLLEVLSGEKYSGKLADKELGRIQQISQASDVLKWLETSLKVDLKRCSPEDLVDGKDKAVFGMLFSIILKYVKLEDEDDAGGADVREALKLWFSRRTAGYKGVEIKDFKSSFNDGLALCALIHKMRPRLIPFDTLSAANKEANLELALENGENYCNVPRILEAGDIATLDEVSMVVYLFDWYYGVATLQKQDVAARRIGKLVKMTQLHDKMRADYTAAAQATTKWIQEKTTWLTGITFDNTLDGIKNQLKELSDYKTGEKAQNVAANLDNDALYNNLQVRLAQAKRPAFAPAGLTPADIDALLAKLDATERETSVRMNKELTHQLTLQALHNRFQETAKKLTEWVATEKGYADATEKADLTEEAQTNLWTLSVHERDVKNARLTRLQDLTDLNTQLSEKNYNKKDEVAASHGEVTAAFEALEQTLAAKRTTLEGDLKREEQKDDAACKGFAELVDAFATFCADQKKEMASTTDKDLESQLAALDAQIATVQGAEEKLKAIAAAQEAIEARNVVANPHTSTTSDDSRALHVQLSLLLSKKRELIQARIEEEKKKGLTEEQEKEIEENFKFFDKNSSGSLDSKELRQCLASLGEDSTPQDVTKILDKYDTNKNGKISKDEFTDFMKEKMGDTNTKEEIISGWQVITLDDPSAKVQEQQLRVLVNDLSWTDGHVDYLLNEQQDSAFDANDGMDYTTWTEAVFKR